MTTPAQDDEVTICENCERVISEEDKQRSGLDMFAEREVCPHCGRYSKKESATPAQDGGLLREKRRLLAKDIYHLMLQGAT